MTRRAGDQTNQPNPTATPDPALLDRLAEDALLGDDDSLVTTTPETSTAKDTKESPETPAPKKTAAERWRDAIKEAGLDVDAANRILDAFVSPGFYHKDYGLMNGRVRVTLRTREHEHVNRVTRAIDRLAQPNAYTVAETMAIYNLAGSLWKYQVRGQPEVVLPFPKKGTDAIEAAKMFDQRMNFLLDSENVPGPVGSLLNKILVEFDRQIAAALSEGAAEGF